MVKSTYDDDWILENYDKYPTNRELLRAYNETHSDVRTEAGMNAHLQQYLKLFRIRMFTKEEVAFMREHYPVLIDNEFLEAFEKEFKWKPKKKHILQSANAFGIKKTPETLFRSKRMQHWRPIGSEKTTMRGAQKNVMVKVADTGDWWTDWRPKQYLVWEAAHGDVPKSHMIVFLDGNTTNCDLENLACIPKRYIGMMNKLFRNESKDPKIRAAKIEWCKLHEAIREKKHDI